MCGSCVRCIISHCSRGAGRYVKNRSSMKKVEHHSDRWECVMAVHAPTPQKPIYQLTPTPTPPPPGRPLPGTSRPRPTKVWFACLGCSDMTGSEAELSFHSLGGWGGGGTQGGGRGAWVGGGVLLWYLTNYRQLAGDVTD